MSKLSFWKPDPYNPDNEFIITKPSLIKVLKDAGGNPVMNSENGLFILQIQELV